MPAPWKSPLGLAVTVLAALTLTGCSGYADAASDPDGDGLNYEVSAVEGAADLNATYEDRYDASGDYQPGVEDSYLSALHGSLDAPNDDFILTGVGGSICFGAEEDGVPATWSEFQGSSYGAHDQVKIFNAALTYLC